MIRRFGVVIVSVMSAILIADWLHKLRLLLTGLVLLQFTAWFEEYWLADTHWLVLAGLAIAFLTEYFPRLSVSIKRLSAMLLIVLIHLYKLDISLIQFRTGEGTREYMLSIGDAIVTALGETTPYIWFSIGAWLMYLATVFWMRERARIMIYIVLSIIIFAIVDSYSKHVLWDQAALIVFCGLGLIIIEHYEHFRKKHPASWSYLAEYPGKVAIPVILIVSLVMVAGIMAPNARPLLQDPYTLYKHWIGEKVITGGKGFADLGSGSQETLDASSGYGRNDEVLGSGFEFDYSEVMRVLTSQRSYWRGETKSLYTGRGWIAGDTDNNTDTVPVTSRTPLQSYDWGLKISSETVKVKQQVMMSDPEADYPVLFGAYSIQSVATDWSTADKPGEVESIPIDAQWSAKHDELRWEESQPYPLVYELVSAMPVTDEAGWRTVRTTDFDEVRFAPYLQLPDTLPERVRNLAVEITSDALTPYDKVKSIEAYLQENFSYTNRPDLSKGESADFVDRFLFEIQEGYCDYFSSAMAAMVRSIGLPTRWVKGFRPGVSEYEEIAQDGIIPDDIAQAQEGEEITYIVRNADAHSWVEVYFPGYGWLPFEPTSGMSIPIVVNLEEAVPAQAEALASISTEDRGDSSIAWFWSTGAIITAALIALLMGVMIAAWRWGMLGGITIRFARNKEERSLNQLAQAEVGRILKLFRKKGFVRGTHETARESFARWSEKNKWLKKDLNLVLSVLEKAKYSPYSVTSDDLAELFRTKKRLKEQL